MAEIITDNEIQVVLKIFESDYFLSISGLLFQDNLGAKELPVERKLNFLSIIFTIIQNNLIPFN